MLSETYKGRKLRVRKGRECGLVGEINGQPMPTRYGVPEQEIVGQLRRDIDLVDAAPVDGNRWGAYMYAPGSFTLCESGHPVALGGQCQHFTCRRNQES